MKDTLLYQTHSPFARKALVFAHEAGLAETLEVIHQETSPLVRNACIFAQNPLGKVPVLLRPGASALFDSGVICAYLDTLHDGERLIPATGEPRWAALRLEAVAEGLAEAGISLRWETVRRPEALRYPALQVGYEAKLAASFAFLEDALETDARPNIGSIAVATVLDWIEFRDLPSFRGQPRLSAWFDDFRERPSMRATPLAGDTVDVRD